MDSEETVVAVTFNLTVDGILNSEFMSVLSLDLAKNLANKMLDSAGEGAAQEEEAAQNPPVADSVPPTTAQENLGQNMEVNSMHNQMPYQAPQNEAVRQNVYTQPPVNIQTAQFQSFDSQSTHLSSEQQDNLQLLMDVPLQISVEIGTARRKVKDILEFTQGTIIELERQAGAPVDIIVNGNLIARGDVVVIDDNFAVRITEIVKSKFMDSLGNKGRKAMDKKILLVDDAAFMRMLIKIPLQNGYNNILEAADGEIAVSMYESEKPDLVVMDITMPNKTGIDALKDIKAFDPNAKIVMCSAMGQEAMVVEAIKLGALDFIVKPFKPDRILQTVSKIIG